MATFPVSACLWCEARKSATRLQGLRTTPACGLSDETQPISACVSVDAAHSRRNVVYKTAAGGSSVQNVLVPDGTKRNRATINNGHFRRESWIASRLIGC
jgi:hypothetical protein